MKNNTILEKADTYNLLTSWLKEGLITSGGQKWKERRRMLTPAFHFRILEEHLSTIDNITRVLGDVLETKEGKWFDITPLMASTTMDIITGTSLGIDLNSLQKGDSEYAQHVKRMGGLIMKRFIQPLLAYDSLYYLLKDGKLYKESNEFVNNYTMKIIKDRKKAALENKINPKDKAEESPKKRKAFLDLLLEEHISNNSLTLEDIEEEVQTFLFAGHDTTSVANGWTFYFMGRHPDIMRRVQEEVDTVLGPDYNVPVTMEQLKELKYTEQVIKESNRLCPPVPFIGRKIDKEFKLGKYTIPKDSTMGCLIIALHRNETYFPNPEVFDPERFTPENCANRHPFAYIPFAAGSRNCIGQRIAMIEQKLALANVARRFNIESRDPFDKLILSSEVILAVHPDGLQIRVSRR